MVIIKTSKFSHRLRVSQPTCGSERIERIIRHDFSDIHHSSEFQRNNGTSGGGAGGFEPAVVLTTDGMLIWADESGLLNQVTYQDFCIDM